MNAIDRIKSRFEIKLPDGPLIEPTAIAPPPCQCGNSQHWRAHHQADWRCVRCTPPPARSLVAQWWPDEAISTEQTGEPNSPPETLAPARIVDESHVTFCRPWCDHCGGWRGIERTFDDGSHTIHCLTCRSELPEVPRPRAVKKKNKIQADEIAA